MSILDQLLAKRKAHKNSVPKGADGKPKKIHPLALQAKRMYQSLQNALGKSPEEYIKGTTAKFHRYDDEETLYCIVPNLNGFASNKFSPEENIANAKQYLADFDKTTKYEDVTTKYTATLIGIQASHFTGTPNPPVRDFMFDPNSVVFNSQNPLEIQDNIVDLIDDKFWRDIEADQKIGKCFGSDFKGFFDQIIATYSLPDEVPADVSAVITEACLEVKDYLHSEILRVSGSETIKMAPLMPMYHDLMPILADEKLVPDEDIIRLVQMAPVDGEQITSLTATTKDKNKGFPFAVSQISGGDWRTILLGANDALLGAANPHQPYFILERRQPSRTTVSDDGTVVVNEKWRDVNCGVKSEALAFGCFWYAAQPILKQIPEFQSYNGYHTLEDFFKPRFDEVRNAAGFDPEKAIVAGLDPSKWDKTLKWILDNPSFWEICKSICPEMDRFFDWAKVHYTEAPIIVPGGVLTGKHGLMSGSGGTPFIGSLCGLVLIRVIQRLTGLVVKLHCQQGDDIAVVFYDESGKVTLSRVVEAAAVVGISIPDDKVKNAWFRMSESHKFFPFVGRNFRLNFGEEDHLKPVFSAVRCVTNMLYPERESPDEQHIRTAGINMRNVYVYDDRGPDPTVELSYKLLGSMMNLAEHPDMPILVEAILPSLPGSLFALKDKLKGAEAIEKLRALDTHMDYQVVTGAGLESNPVVGVVMKLLEAMDESPFVGRISMAEVALIHKSMKGKLDLDSLDDDSPEVAAVNALASLSEDVIRGDVLQKLKQQLF